MGLQELAPVPVIIAVVELIKQYGLPSKYAPLLALLLGLAVSFFSAQTVSIEAGLEGLVLGLSASGLYSGGKVMLK